MLSKPNLYFTYHLCPTYIIHYITYVYSPRGREMGDGIIKLECKYLNDIKFIFSGSKIIHFLSDRTLSIVIE